MNPLTAMIALVVSALIGLLGGIYIGKHDADLAVTKAVAAANQANLKLNDEVVYAWARSVDFLRSRIRAGNAPRIPLPPTDPKDPAGGTNGGTTDNLPASRELETCRAERKQVVEDCALTTIQLKALQQWAK